MWLLLARGDVKVDTLDGDGMTALLHAVYRGHEAIRMNLLVPKSILADGVGLTPLSYAAEMGHEILTLRLLTTGLFEPNLPDVYEKRPLDCAVLGGQTGVTRLLIEAGRVDICKPVGGRNLLCWGVEQGDTYMVKILLQVEVELEAQPQGTQLIVAVGHESQPSTCRHDRSYFGTGEGDCGRIRPQNTAGSGSCQGRHAYGEDAD